MKLLRRHKFSAAAVLVLGLLTAACVHERVITGIYIAGYAFRNHALGNLRWEMAQHAIHPSENLRLKVGDEFRPLWDKFYGFWEREGQMCSFNDVNVSTESCRVCQDCNPTESERFVDPCGYVVYSKSDIGSFEIFEYPGFMTTPENERLVHEGPSSEWLCSTGIKIAARTDATYRLPLPDNDDPHETKVYAYSESPRSVAYPLQRQTIDNKSYWIWSIQGVGKWLENYSPNLQVANVRIYEGVCATDMNSGDCRVPAEAQRIKASRVLFLPKFNGSVDSANEASFRCYSSDREDAQTMSFIDLRSCLGEYQSQSGQLRLATPTYMQGNEFDRLTWLVEFNTNEGGSVVSADAKLIIEFSIVAL
jgi:hypothetical protein